MEVSRHPVPGTAGLLVGRGMVEEATVERKRVGESVKVVVQVSAATVVVIV